MAFDKPFGCFSQLLLVCEIVLTKQRRIFVNATVCTDLIPGEFYRVYVETRQIGWETVVSRVIEAHLTLNGNSFHKIKKILTFVQFIFKNSLDFSLIRKK